MSYHNGALKSSKVYERALEGVEDVCEKKELKELAALAKLVEDVVVSDPIWLTLMTESLWSEKEGLRRDIRRRHGVAVGVGGSWGTVWKSEIGEMEGWASGVSGLGDGVVGYEILMYLRVGTLFRYRCGG